MKKLGKASLLAIIECALFISGAVFFLVVLLDASNPLWALVIGLILAGAGVIVWVSPVIMRMAHGVPPQKSVIVDPVADATDTYELHRPVPQVSHDDNTDAKTDVDLDF